jgi:hypothetical protein
MSSMRFNARLDTSHRGPPHPFTDAGAVADSLTGIHSAMCLFVVNRTCIHKGLQVSPQVNIQRMQVRRAWRPCSGSSSTYPSRMLVRTSRTARLKCFGAPSRTHRIRAQTASGTSSSSVANHVRGNVGSGCLEADVAKHAGLPNNYQQSVPTH